MPLRIVMPNVPPSEAIIQTVAEKSGGQVVLAFSGGKDAVAAWIALKRAGVKVFPYFYYIHPHLEFVNRTIDYYEEKFGEKITRVPNSTVYRWWIDCTYATPEQVAPCMAASLPVFNAHDLQAGVIQHLKLPATTFTALGVRAADSIFRRTMFTRSGAINHKNKKFYPVWDWTKEEVRVEIFKAKLKLPIDYWLFGRSFDGLDYRFIAPVKKHFPKDYERLREYYPFIECELKRAEFAGKTDHL